MSEKRFNFDDESRIWDDGIPMTALDIVMMLNEQQDIIKSKDSLLSILSKENEQLKQENNMLKITIGRNESYIKRLTHQSDWHC